MTGWRELWVIRTTTIVAVNRIVSEKGYEIYNSTKVSRPWAGQVAKATTCSPQGSKVKTDHTVHISKKKDGCKL